MSKTMDNDSKNYLADALDNAFIKKDAEISRLNKFNTELSNINDTLRARVEELEADLAELEFVQRGTLQDGRRAISERDSLKARVEELETSITHTSVVKVLKERDALRAELAALNPKSTDYSANYYGENIEVALAVCVKLNAPHVYTRGINSKGHKFETLTVSEPVTGAEVVG